MDATARLTTPLGWHGWHGWPGWPWAAGWHGLVVGGEGALASFTIWTIRELSGNYPGFYLMGQPAQSGLAWPCWPGWHGWLAWLAWLVLAGLTQMVCKHAHSVFFARKKISFNNC